VGNAAEAAVAVVGGVTDTVADGVAVAVEVHGDDAAAAAARPLVSTGGAVGSPVRHFSPLAAAPHVGDGGEHEGGMVPAARAVDVADAPDVDARTGSSTLEVAGLSAREKGHGGGVAGRKKSS